MDIESALPITLIDLALISIFIAFMAYFRRSRTNVSRTPTALIYFGFSVLAAYYLIDLVLLWIAPLVVGEQLAELWLQTLHLDASWPFALVAIISLLSGFSLILRHMRAMAEASAQTAQHLNETIEALPDGLLILDKDNIILRANSAAGLMFECHATDLLGKQLSELLYQYDDNVELTNRRLPATTASGKRFPVELSIAELTNESGRLVLVRDVTHLAGLENQLRQSQKMESLGQFAGGIAHDFNNYLTVILGEADLLSIRLSETHKASSIRIREAAEKAAELTNQLLTFSRKQNLDARVIDLNQELSRLDALLRNLLGKDIDLYCVRDSTLGAVRIDVSQLEQTIVNLTINAKDAMPDGGKLTIETDNVYLDETFCRTHPNIEPGHYVMLAVTDVGVGMSPDVIAHIFEPFYTTKPRGRGTGLGLSMVMGFIEQSDGTVTVQSEPGSGTKIRLFLPRVDAQVVDAEVADTQPDTLATASEVEIQFTGRARVSIVEDDDAVRTFVVKALREHGYDVTAYSNAEAILAADTLDTDLVLTDVVMPAINGFELAEQLLQKKPGLNVLFMTGFIDYNMVNDVAAARHPHILRKPFTVRELLSSVQQNLNTDRTEAS